MASDIELLESWRAGDRRAGDELLGRHIEPLYRFFAYKVGSDASDLIQETMAACIDARDRFRGDASFRTYLFQIARNKLSMYWRKAKRAPDIDFGVSSLDDLGPSPATVLAKKREERLLLEALRRIPVDLQIAIELHYWEGLTTAELGTVLDIPQGTAKSRLRRAREQLEAQLRELAESPAELASTLDDLEHWAQRTAMPI